MAIPSCLTEIRTLETWIRSFYRCWHIYGSPHADSATYLRLWFAVKKSFLHFTERATTDPTFMTLMKCSPVLDGITWLRTSGVVTGIEHIPNRGATDTYIFLPSQQQTRWWSQSPHRIRDTATRRLAQSALGAAAQRNLCNKQVTYQYHISVYNHETILKTADNRSPKHELFITTDNMTKGWIYFQNALFASFWCSFIVNRSDTLSGFSISSTHQVAGCLQ